MKYIVKTMADNPPSYKDSLFLGTWCVSKPCLRLSGDEHFVPYLWRDKHIYNKTALNIKSNTPYLFKKFVNSLNDIHNENLPHRYWAIITQRWFSDYLQTFYDRYLTIENLKNKFDNFEYRCLDYQHFNTPYGMSQFIDLLSTDDKTNEQIYSQILNENYIKRIRFYDNKLCKVNITPKLNNVIDICSLYQGHVEDVKYIYNGLKGLGRFCVLKREFETVFESYGLNKRRLRFMEHANSCSDFERVLFKSLIINTPKSLVEGFADSRQLVLRDYALPRLSVTTNDHVYCYLPKIMMAESVLLDRKIIWGQHGANYGAFDLDLDHDHEFENANRYYSWGWSYRNSKRFKNMPSLSISGLVSRNKKCEANGRLLFIGNNSPKYLFNFRSHPVATDVMDYSDMQLDFIKHISPNIKNKICYRPYHNDYGQGVEERITMTYPDIRVIKGGDVSEIINKFNLVVIDRPDCSSFGNLLGLNRPFIVFYDKEKYKYSKLSVDIFHKMHQAGIVQYCEKEAATFINKIFENVDKWWNTFDVQQARKMYCDRFAYYTPNYCEEWINEILKEYYCEH
jgi:putative transferase (TIGR04331 family)